MNVSFIDLEAALDLEGRLNDDTVVIAENGSTRVVSGLHPTCGAIHIVFPAIGECVAIAGVFDRDQCRANDDKYFDLIANELEASDPPRSSFPS
jgi:hypothetical protein